MSWSTTKVCYGHQHGCPRERIMGAAAVRCQGAAQLLSGKKMKLVPSALQGAGMDKRHSCAAGQLSPSTHRSIVQPWSHGEADTHENQRKSGAAATSSSGCACAQAKHMPSHSTHTPNVGSARQVAVLL
eukprot:1145401-Pelagomonas_calceolata.AAC.16